MLQQTLRVDRANQEAEGQEVDFLQVDVRGWARMKLGL